MVWMIKLPMLLSDIRTPPHELSSLAYKVEQHRKAKEKGIVSKPPPPRSYPFQRPPNITPRPQAPPPPRSNPSNAQNTPQRNPPKPEDRRRCFRCQGLGHIASECPNKRIVTLAEFQASFKGLDGENEEQEEHGSKESLEEVEEGPDEGELLVIRRALSGLASQDELEQRDSIFHTRCTMGGKVCSLIIDGRSCANVASQSMVDKLKLSMTPHPKPYTIQWLNQSKGLQMSSRCLLSLSIGKTYKDEI